MGGGLRVRVEVLVVAVGGRLARRVAGVARASCGGVGGERGGRPGSGRSRSRIVKYRGVEIRGAYMDTLACVIFMRLLDRPEVAPLLADLLRGLALSMDTANQLAVEQVESTIAQMRSARGELLRHRDEAEGSAGGTSEPVEATARARSAASSPWTGRVAEVAERLELSESYVKRLCRNQVLSATKSGREWVIDQASVDAYEAARRPVA